MYNFGASCQQQTQLPGKFEVVTYHVTAIRRTIRLFVTTDEIWIHFNTPEKEKSKQWKLQTSRSWRMPRRVYQSRSRILGCQRHNSYRLPR